MPFVMVLNVVGKPQDVLAAASDDGHLPLVVSLPPTVTRQDLIDALKAANLRTVE